MDAILLAVDIGTGSVRVGFFDRDGKLLGLDVTPISTYRSSDNADIYQQSSDEIWDAVILSMKASFQKALSSLGRESVRIGGLCVDATCSLAFADSTGAALPLTTGNGSSYTQNIIMWLDHRALKETAIINSTRHIALLSYGGGVSLEMEPPKLLWLKTHKPHVWDRVSVALDLADFITYKFTKRSDVRSSCTMACKWAYDSVSRNYREDFWDIIGLSDVVAKLLSPSIVISPGVNIKGEIQDVLRQIGIPYSETIGVSAGVVDAYAGALGSLATKVVLDGKQLVASQKGTMICGTSTCLFVFSESSSPPVVNGVWGPFFGVLGNNLWVYEAGQSAAGKLLDWLFQFHPAGRTFEVNDRSLRLQQHLESMAKKQGLKSFHLLTRDVHVCPDFHGNRSPLARADMRGMFFGLDFDVSIDSLALFYLATIQSLAYNVRFMFEVFSKHGVESPEVMVACGGLARDTLYLQTHADILLMPFAVPNCAEVVLLGNAILAAVASGIYATVDEACAKMASECDIILPTTEAKLIEFHDKKYKVYRKLLADQLEILSTMQD